MLRKVSGLCFYISEVFCALYSYGLFIARWIIVKKGDRTHDLDFNFLLLASFYKVDVE